MFLVSFISLSSLFLFAFLSVVGLGEYDSMPLFCIFSGVTMSFFCLFHSRKWDGYGILGGVGVGGRKLSLWGCCAWV